MRDILNQFVSNTIGNFQEVSYKDAIYQCMDLVYEYVFVLRFPKATIQNQYAYEVFTKATDFTREYFEIIPNLKETIPMEGDIVVWDKTKTNVAGHIGIVLEATQTKMKVFDQNKPLGTNANISDETYANCLGFLRPKNVIIDGVPNWLKTLLQERGLTISDESQIRIIFDKAQKYENEVKGLTEQIKTTNEQLADKALEVSDLVRKNESLTADVEKYQKLYNETYADRNSLADENQRLIRDNDSLIEQTDGLKKELENKEEQFNQLKSEFTILQNAKLKTFSSWTLIVNLFGRIFGK